LSLCKQKTSDCQVVSKSSVDSSSSRNSVYAGNAENVLRHLQGLMYRFFNMANIAITQAGNLYLQEYVRYAVENANLLKSRKNKVDFSKYKYKCREFGDFSSFVDRVTYLVCNAQTYYKAQFHSRNSVPFLNVSHDGWDSNDHDILGVSIHLLDPNDWTEINLAIGL
jgi:hypothetical protein